MTGKFHAGIKCLPVPGLPGLRMQVGLEDPIIIGELPNLTHLNEI